jgi:hypothetical protein
MDIAFVELVEDHHADTGQFRVVDQAAGQDTLGNHLDAGGGADPAFHTHPVADGPADILTQQFRHAPRRHARRQPPGLQHQYLAAAQPVLAQQRQRNQRRLAGPGRGLEDGACTVAQCFAQPRQGFRNW